MTKHMQKIWLTIHYGLQMDEPSASAFTTREKAIHHMYSMHKEFSESYADAYHDAIEQSNNVFYLSDDEWYILEETYLDFACDWAMA